MPLKITHFKSKQPCPGANAQWVNKLRPSDVNIQLISELGHHWFMVMAWCLFKPSPNSILTYHQWEVHELTPETFEQKYNYFRSSKCIWKCCLENVSFCSSLSVLSLAPRPSLAPSLAPRQCSVWHQDPSNLWELSQQHDWWCCLSFLHHQVISGHDTEYVKWGCSCLLWQWIWITSDISMTRND